MAEAPTLDSSFRGLPGIDSPQFLQACKELLEDMAGQRGTSLSNCLTLNDLANPEVVVWLNQQGISVTMSTPQQGVQQGKARPPQAPYDLKRLSDDDSDRLAAMSNHLIWTLPPDNDIVSTEIWMADTNDRANAIRIGIVTYPQNEYVHDHTAPMVTYYYWARCKDWAGLYSDFTSTQTTGLQLGSDESVNEEVNRLMELLYGEDPPVYNAGSTYFIPDRVSWEAPDGGTRTYTCINDLAGSGISGISPDNIVYWTRTGILAQGDVGGNPTVGVDGTLIVDGTIIADALIVTELSAITADVGTLTAGLIQSDNYVADTSGIQIDLDNATITCFETAGISIESVGGLTITDGGGISIEEGGDIILAGDDSNPGLLKFDTGSGDYINLGTDNTQAALYLYPDNADGQRLFIGSELGTIEAFFYIGIYGQTINLKAYYDVTNQSNISMYADTASGYVSITADNSIGGTQCQLKLVSSSSGSTQVLFWGDEILPNADKSANLGTAVQAWDDMYADDFNNVADFPFLDTYNDVATIKAIKPNGKTDSKSGLPLIDDDTLPEWLLSKDEYTGQTEYNSEGKPYIPLKAAIALAWGAVRELSERIDILEGNQDERNTDSRE